ncbi:hypothetical protein [Qipengyuania sp. MTN3-11]|uniref:spike base protein, RCAP_Rcc01079 family n=1 Tax=Qipengyuania sp. MTN3-11 TaxID=3056557 RepID=UPI0036F31A29
MIDRFENFAPGLSAPATRAEMVTPSDLQSLPFLPRAVYVGGTGDLVMRDQSGTETAWRNVPAGTLLPFRPAMIRASGTTATDMLVID